MSKIAEPTGDGRYIIDPSKIEWEDVLRFEEALDKGPYPEEPKDGFGARIIKTLLGIPDAKDAYVVRHTEAVGAMLDGANGKGD